MDNPNDILFEEQSESSFLDFSYIIVPYHAIYVVSVHIELLADLFYGEVKVGVFCQCVVDIYNSRPEVVGNTVFFLGRNLMT